MVATGVVLASGLLGWWRWHHSSWLTTIYAAVIGVLMLAISVLLLMRARTDHDRRVGDTMLISGLVPLTVAAAAAAPGPVGSPNAVLGFRGLTTAALLALEFTGP